MCVSDNVSRRRSSFGLLAGTEAFQNFTRSINDDGEDLDRDAGNSSSHHTDGTAGRVTVTSSGAPKNQEKHCVQHNYHDHANDLDTYFRNNTVAATNKGGVTVPFPLKLWNMLDHIDNKDPVLEEVVSWQPHGRCFLVHKPQEFAKDVLSRFFQQKKYASFQRQLNLYGFKRITKGPDRGSYYHELFLRGKQFLCSGIARLKIKGTGARMPSNPDAEPDFYKMTPITRNRGLCPQNRSPWPMATNDAPCDQRPNLPAHVSSAPLQNIHDSNNRQPRRVRDMQYRDMLSSSVATSQPMRYEYKEDRYPTKFKTEDNLDYVFDDMPFHVVAGNQNHRRHSLLVPRKNSTRTYTPFSEANMGEDFFDDDMDHILTLGDNDLPEEDMMEILRKIV